MAPRGTLTVQVIGLGCLFRQVTAVTPRDEEYRALRTTIRQRGTARVSVFVAGLAVWAALALATTALGAIAVTALVPLLVLAAAFEAVYSLHVSVERIGRYLQVY